MRRTFTIACAAMLVAGVGPPAVARAVSLEPTQLAVEQVATLTLRVPNNRDYTKTTKVELGLPPAVELFAAEQVPGWTTHLHRTDERVDQVTWIANSGEGPIPPFQFRDFEVSAVAHGKAGDQLVFGVVQNWANSERESWTGAPDERFPPPRLTLTRPVSVTPEDGTTHASGHPAAAVRTRASAGTDDDSGAPTWLAVLALVIGGAGLLSGLGALVATRRRPAAT